MTTRDRCCCPGVCHTLKFPISGCEYEEKFKQRFSLNYKILPSFYFLYREYSIGKILCLIFAKLNK
jgi:hypothetical protein